MRIERGDDQGDCQDAEGAEQQECRDAQCARHQGVPDERRDALADGGAGGSETARRRLRPQLAERGRHEWSSARQRQRRIGDQSDQRRDQEEPGEESQDSHGVAPRVCSSRSLLANETRLS